MLYLCIYGWVGSELRPVGSLLQCVGLSVVVTHQLQSMWAYGCGCVSPRECGLCALWPQAFQRQLLRAMNDAVILGLQRRVW